MTPLTRRLFLSRYCRDHAPRIETERDGWLDYALYVVACGLFVWMTLSYIWRTYG